MLRPPRDVGKLTLKQFMLRSEILKLYRDFMRLGRHLNSPPSEFTSPSSSTSPRNEWERWVRSEFRLRIESSADDQIAAALLQQGKRQLQEMQRTVALATNTNFDPKEFKKP